MCPGAIFVYKHDASIVYLSSSSDRHESLRLLSCRRFTQVSAEERERADRAGISKVLQSSCDMRCSQTRGSPQVVSFRHFA